MTSSIFIKRNVKALCYGRRYQRRMARPNDKKVKPRNLKKGDMMLKKTLPFKDKTSNKSKPNYDISYLVTEVL